MNKLIATITLLLLVLPFFVFGQAGERWPIEQIPETSPILSGGVTQVLLTIFRWVFTILMYLAGAFAVLYIIYGGIQVIIQAKIDEGKNRLIFGAVGLVIALLSWAIVQFISNFVQQAQF